jgi:hypothetical protein
MQHHPPHHLALSETVLRLAGEVLFLILVEENAGREAKAKSKAAKWKEKQPVLAPAGVSFALIASAVSFSRSR